MWEIREGNVHTFPEARKKTSCAQKTLISKGSSTECKLHEIQGCHVHSCTLHSWGSQRAQVACLPAAGRMVEWTRYRAQSRGNQQKELGTSGGGLMPKTLQVALCNKLWDTKGRAIFCCPRLMGPTHITWDWLREGSILIHKVPKPASQQNSKWEM